MVRQLAVIRVSESTRNIVKEKKNFIDILKSLFLCRKYQMAFKVKF